MATANEIVTYLISIGVGTTFGTDIFIDSIPAPDEDDAAVMVGVFGGGGRSSVGTFGTQGVDRERPTLQFRFRGLAYDSNSPRATAQTAFEGLHRVGVTLSSTFYHTLIPQQAPFILEEDAAGRVTWAFNVAIEKELSA
jgi:hypothetical protein